MARRIGIGSASEIKFVTQSGIHFSHFFLTQFADPFFQTILIKRQELGAVDMPLAGQVTVALSQRDCEGIDLRQPGAADRNNNCIGRKLIASIILNDKRWTPSSLFGPRAGLKFTQ